VALIDGYLPAVSRRSPGSAATRDDVAVTEIVALMHLATYRRSSPGYI
jgi:hypothetical protein